MFYTTTPVTLRGRLGSPLLHDLHDSKAHPPNLASTPEKPFPTVCKQVTDIAIWRGGVSYSQIERSLRLRCHSWSEQGTPILCPALSKRRHQVDGAFPLLPPKSAAPCLLCSVEQCSAGELRKLTRQTLLVCKRDSWVVYFVHRDRGVEERQARIGLHSSLGALSPGLRPWAQPGLRGWGRVFVGLNPPERPAVRSQTNKATGHTAAQGSHIASNIAVGLPFWSLVVQKKRGKILDLAPKRQLGSWLYS